MVNPTTLVVSTFFGDLWVMNPWSNGTGQEQYAFDSVNPNILYFWDSTLSILFRLNRNTSQLRQLLALDQSTPVGQHFSTSTNRIVFDPRTGTVLLADGPSKSVLEVDPRTSPPTVTAVLSGLPFRPSRIALNPDTNEIFIADPNLIFFAPRSGGSISLVASDFTSLSDIVVGNATGGVGFSVFAVDRALNTVYEITRDSH